MEQSIAMEMVAYQALCCLALGEAQLHAGRLEDAHALAEQALTLAHAHQERGNEVYALHLLGDVAARRKPLESALAETHYREALALAEELGMRPLQAHIELSTAINLYRAMEMTFWLPEAEAALAQVER
jgi:hypothetical protein